MSSLKENFKDLYDLIKKNQNENGPNGLLFFIPSSRFYVKTQLTDINFYYSHIFQRSKYDPTLYVNFVGKVLKSEDGKKYESYLGWSKNMSLVVKSSFTNEENVTFCITDGICIDELTQISIIGKDTDSSLMIERCNTSAEYIKHYGSQDKEKKNKKYQKAKEILNLFIKSMKNNNILMKGYEIPYSTIFQENVNNIVSIFTSIFRNERIAVEFVDSYVFKGIYDEIMNKLRNFYEEEEKEIAKVQAKGNDKYELDTLKLPKCLSKCDFEIIYSGLKSLYLDRSCFEKTNHLSMLNKQLIEIAKEVCEKESGKPLEIHGDFLLNIWSYIIFHSKVPNLIAEAVFLNIFQFKKAFGADDYIVNNFIIVMEQIKNEIIKKDNDVNIQFAKPFIIETSE